MTFLYATLIVGDAKRPVPYTDCGLLADFSLWFYEGADNYWNLCPEAGGGSCFPSIGSYMWNSI